MSVSSLPEWKQLLLEKKKREEVERGRREKEEEEKLASMPAWKRGIIQRRRAKQETVGDKEKDRDFSSQVLLETIVPVHENPFIRTQSGWKKGRDGEPGTETEVKERDKMNPRGQDAETRRNPPDHSDPQDCVLRWRGNVGQNRSRGTRLQRAGLGSLEPHRVPAGEDEAEGAGEDATRRRRRSRGWRRAPPHPVISPTPQPKQTITIVPSFLRNQSSENSLKPANCAPTPASSPSSLSPAQSPCPSPSPTPSPVLFSIKSASGGHVKRGATITVTPKKPCGGGGGGTRPALPTAPTKPPPQQTSPATADPGRKKYPTVEEIEVIGGYQNLERSCLIKSRGTPKRGKVCFHEDQLEQVCEYPSETSMLTFNPLLHDGSKVDKPRAGEVQEEEGEAEAGLVKSTRSVGIAPRLRVGQCHPQLNKHKVEFLSRAKDSVVLRKPVRRELYSICGNVVQHLVI
uniref:Phostensin/Taperin PP1-binding domain-containing protein n=1 Tax=Oryzias latipes TaxID=8090 RepID=A0A3P9I560_ORYLA